MVRSVFGILISCIGISGCGLNDVDDRMNLAIYSGDGNVEGVIEYIHKVDTLNYISLKGETPLNSAAHNGHVQIVKILLGKGASCTYEDSYGKNAYETAVEQNQVEVQKYLQNIEGCSGK